MSERPARDRSHAVRVSTAVFPELIYTGAKESRKILLLDRIAQTLQRPLGLAPF